ncbi:MAG: leucyl aminopeptidase [Rhizobiaceae bacterium]
MSFIPSLTFAKPGKPVTGLAFILSAADNKIAPASEAVAGSSLAKAIAAADFKSKANTTMELLVPAGTQVDRLVVVGVGKPAELDANAWMKLGGTVASKLGNAKLATVNLELGAGEATADNAADFALGLLMRAYAFDKYKTKKEDNGKPTAAAKISIQIADPAAVKRKFVSRQAAFDGVCLARDLVNEPANILGTLEFAAKAAALASLGVKVSTLTEKEMKKLGMGALLGVAQGSVRPPRMVIMRWNGGKAKDKPIAFVGKGVVFDSGGISIKPAAGMEDMKGDMGGAAAVTGLMHTLAARKAKANVIGIIGLVENMIDANAQRPGDIVTSMSGQTIEVLNTDAEGRLVLADALHYCRTKFEPRFMVNLATLTGAILVALGNIHAGLFSNNDELAQRLTAAGLSTGERLWRMPMGPEYDKLIDTPNADMKNIGGRYGGSITAAQFLQRFVGDTPWAHLDIAGTAMGSPSNETNAGWASGFGVRLLDRLVADHYES